MSCFQTGPALKGRRGQASARESPEQRLRVVFRPLLGRGWPQVSLAACTPGPAPKKETHPPPALWPGDGGSEQLKRDVQALSMQKSCKAVFSTPLPFPNQNPSASLLTQHPHRRAERCEGALDQPQGGLRGFRPPFSSSFSGAAGLVPQPLGTVTAHAPQGLPLPHQRPNLEIVVLRAQLLQLSHEAARPAV